METILALHGIFQDEKTVGKTVEKTAITATMPQLLPAEQ